MVWDLGLEEDDDEAVGEVVDWAGSGLVVDMVALWGSKCYWFIREGLCWLLESRGVDMGLLRRIEVMVDVFELGA
jgi:hypothetical protein